MTSVLWLLPLWMPLLGAPPQGAPPPGSPVPEAAPLTLEECFRAALTRNERIARALEDVEQARLDKRQAWAAVLPGVNLEDTYYRQNRVDLGGAGSAFTFADRRNQALVRLSQPIFRGLSDHNALAAASRAIDASRYAVEDEARALYADVALAFFSVLQSEAQVETLESTVGVERERLREIRARAEVGLARRTEVLLIESQLAEDEASLLGARNNLLLAREQLGFLMAAESGGALRDDVTIPDPLEPPDASRAASNRSDIRRLEAEVEAAARRVAVARGEHLPSIDLDADFILSRDNFSEFAQETDWTAELSFRLPLFEGGRIRANVARARSLLKQATLARDEQRRRIGLQVQSAWLLLQSALAQRHTLEASLAASGESYELASEEYRAGISSNLEVIASQNLLLSNRLTLERQRHQVKLDWILLRLAAGDLPLPGVPAAERRELPAREEEARP